MFGTVAIVFGSVTVIFGNHSLPSPNAAAVNIDSELRFYAAWYVIAGVLALRVARRVERETFLLRLLSTGLFLGGTARVISLIAVGVPDPTQIALMIVELILPVVLVVWQGALARVADQYPEQLR